MVKKIFPYISTSLFISLLICYFLAHKVSILKKEAKELSKCISIATDINKNLISRNTSLSNELLKRVSSIDSLKLISIDKLSKTSTRKIKIRF
jgi:hypothetical protein